MEYDGGSDLLKLAELLKPPSDPEKDDTKTGCDLTHLSTNVSPYQRFPDKTPRTLEEFEQQMRDEVKHLSINNKKLPSYDIKYRQAITAEDVFLQMGMKTASSASCEDMILTICLSNETFSALDLNLTKTNVKIDGFVYNLDLDLPHTIDPKRSKAEWDSDNEKLVLTMRLVREFDFVNF